MSVYFVKGRNRAGRGIAALTAVALSWLMVGQPIAEAVVLSESLDQVKGKNSGSPSFDRTTDSLEAIGETAISIESAVILASGTAITGTLTTTNFTTDLTNATDNFYAGLLVSFTSGSNAGQTRRISSYTGATKLITVGNAFSNAPLDSEAFVLLPGVVSNTGLDPAVWTDPKAGYLDAAITTRAPAATALTSATWTNGRAGNLDNLDAAVSSRSTLAQADILSDATPFQGARIDATISSRAPASTALTTATWTNGRAGNLDNLDAAMTSRAPASTALTSATWTNGRAANLDNLDAAVSSRSTLTQAQVLSDATPFQGARIDAAISSRSTLTQANLLSDATPFAGGDVGAIKGYVDTEVLDIKNATAQLKGTVNDAGASASATVFITDLASAVDDFYNGAMLVFTSGALTGQARRISDYVGATKTVTLASALTAAPVDTVSFVLTPGMMANTGLDPLVWTDPKAGYLDAAITTRAPAATALTDATWTNGRAGNLDNLDAAVSSRSTLAQADILSDATPFQGARIDATISSRAPASTAVSNVDYTAGRAGNLDNLDAAITTRAPAATALTSATWTNGRAANLDNLDAAVSSRSTLTQAQVLSDATPFAGADIAAIKAKGADIDAIKGYVDTEVAAIKAKTDLILTSGAGSFIPRYVEDVSKSAYYGGTAVSVTQGTPVTTALTIPRVCKINRIVVTGTNHAADTSSNFDVEIFGKTGGVYSVYKAVGYDTTTSAPYGMDDVVDFVFKNRDVAQADTLYLKITNNTGSDTTVFDIEVYGLEMSQ